MTTGIARLESRSHAPQSPQTPRSLFGPTHLNEAQVRRLVDCGLRGISQQKPADTWQILGVLAECSDLPPDQAQRTKVIAWSFEWLERHMPQCDAHVLLGSLLALEDLSATETGRVVEWSFVWLEHHADGTAGTFAVQGAEELLGALLSLELDAAQVQRLDVHLRERKAAGGRASGEATSARRLREGPAFG
ncbi:hypothetical protein [Streptomyces anulatus]|uniref:hypothetical protein n=1 Tax=Streptomyces anulatus TaxID=1892 RepID=UPI0036B2976E